MAVLVLVMNIRIAHKPYINVSGVERKITVILEVLDMRIVFETARVIEVVSKMENPRVRVIILGW